MKKFLLFLILFLPLSGLWADQLEEVYSRISSHPVTKGELTQEQYIKVANRSLVSKGTFVMAADKGIIFDITDPFPSSMVVTEEKMVQTLPGNVISVLDGSENAMFKNIARIIHSVFANDVQVLKDNFQVSVTGGPKDVVTLVPKDPLLSKKYGTAFLFLKLVQQVLLFVRHELNCPDLFLFQLLCQEGFEGQFLFLSYPLWKYVQSHILLLKFPLACLCPLLDIQVKLYS